MRSKVPDEYTLDTIAQEVDMNAMLLKLSSSGSGLTQRMEHTSLVEPVDVSKGQYRIKDYQTFCALPQLDWSEHCFQ